MSIVYILFSPKLKKFYVGSSREDSVETRLSHHNNGSVRSTKSGKPWNKVEVEKFMSYTEARKRELYLKSGVGRKSIYERFGHLKLNE